MLTDKVICQQSMSVLALKFSLIYFNNIPEQEYLTVTMIYNLN